MLGRRELLIGAGASAAVLALPAIAQPMAAQRGLGEFWLWLQRQDCAIDELAARSERDWGARYPIFESQNSRIAVFGYSGHSSIMVVSGRVKRDDHGCTVHLQVERADQVPEIVGLVFPMSSGVQVVEKFA